MFFLHSNIFLFSQQNKDGSYTGFIKVQFKLARPVSVPPPKKGGSDAGGRKSSGVKRRTSFYLPKDASKHLHISSRTSAREVIEALLKKFTVVDNPGKFALFERSERHDQGIYHSCYTGAYILNYSPILNHTELTLFVF